MILNIILRKLPSHHGEVSVTKRTVESANDLVGLRYVNIPIPMESLQ